jgi:hypothetical protein
MVVGTSLATALWVYTYRVHPVIHTRFQRPNGEWYSDGARTISEQPWWSPYAALVILIIGVALAVVLSSGATPLPVLRRRNTSAGRTDSRVTARPSA